MPVQRTQLLESIANTVADYRQGEIAPITPAHVARWVNQFDAADQLTILTEMDSILKRFYFSRARVKAFYRGILGALVEGKISQTLIDKQSPQEILQHIKFLDIQRTGESQRDLLKILTEVLREDYAISIDKCGIASPTIYFYLDDAIYTGNRLRYDLTEGEGAVAWIPRQAPELCGLVICTLASHTAGFEYVSEYIEKAASAKRIVVNYITAQEIDNRRYWESEVECLWPDALPSDPEIDRFVSYTRGQCKKWGWPAYDFYPRDVFRPAGTPPQETFFSSSANRSLVESAFFTAGFQLIKNTSFYKGGSSLDRPLGFEKLPSLGFGTLFVTYRNIANNCPLVLWSERDGWFPLFPRKTNLHNSNIIRRVTINIKG
jgi:hypothetical protein